MRVRTADDIKSLRGNIAHLFHLGQKGCGAPLFIYYLLSILYYLLSFFREDNILPYKFKGFILIRFNVTTAPRLQPPCSSLYSELPQLTWRTMLRLSTAPGRRGAYFLSEIYFLFIPFNVMTHKKTMKYKSAICSTWNKMDVNEKIFFAHFLSLIFYGRIISSPTNSKGLF